MAHLRAIHRHLFQDVFDWAGELRTVEISKGGHQFQFRRFIETGMADVHRRLAAQDFLRGSSASEFAESAGAILGDVNYCHPFREGNGRTQLVYLRQLAAQAGHRLRLERLDRKAWMDASREAHLGRYEAMARCIAAAMQPNKDPERDRRQRKRRRTRTRKPPGSRPGGWVVGVRPLRRRCHRCWRRPPRCRPHRHPQTRRPSRRRSGWCNPLQGRPWCAAASPRPWCGHRPTGSRR